MGRKPKLVGRARWEFIGALKGGSDVAIAASIAGVSAQTARATIKRSPKFAQEVEDAKAIADDLVVRRLYQAALDGDVTAMRFWLKNRRAKVWRDRHELAVDAEVRSYNISTTRRPEPEPDRPDQAPDADG